MVLNSNFWKESILFSFIFYDSKKIYWDKNHVDFSYGNINMIKIVSFYFINSFKICKRIL